MITNISILTLWVTDQDSAKHHVGIGRPSIVVDHVYASFM